MIICVSNVWKLSEVFFMSYFFLFLTFVCLSVVDLVCLCVFAYLRFKFACVDVCCKRGIAFLCT